MRPDLGSVLSFYGVDYRPHRVAQKVLCPLHGERDPSMHVELEKGLFYCHSCGEGGTALQMIMKKEGLDYERAREFATDHGIPGAGTDGGGEDVQLGLMAGRRLPGRQRDHKGKRRYIPSWRSG